MRFFCFVLFLFCTAKIAHSDSTVNKPLDLNDIDRHDILWMTLFSRINTILSETTKLSEGLMILNKRLDEQELKSTDFMKKSQIHFTDLKKSQNELERKLSEFMENSENPFTELKKRQYAEEQLSKQCYNHNHEWTTILRRQDGSVDFYRNWTEYQKGFGNPDGEFFIGLDRLNAMTEFGGPQELIVILRDSKNQQRIAEYDLFRIGNETEKYAIKELGTYRGDAGDSLSGHKGIKFTTYDQNNDVDSDLNCAKNFKGAWWFNDCYYCHLFGLYRSENETNKEGITWKTWNGYLYSFKFAEMKIRPKLY